MGDQRPASFLLRVFSMAIPLDEQGAEVFGRPEGVYFRSRVYGMSVPICAVRRGPPAGPLQFEDAGEIA
jgi:hypothetical protein